MPDRAMEALPRIALVFGDEAAVAHVREAMADHADIAYAVAANAFDASRLVSAGATSALVNLDGGDWLDDVETKLHAAGVAVVFNDPEISQKLEGWERARWLRHLVAKLRGSRDVDPPRPEVAPSPSVPTTKAEFIAATDENPAPPAGSLVVERPLSPEEIETMTVDFVAEQASVPVELSSPVAAAAEAVEAGENLVSLDVSEQVAAVESSISFEPTLESPAATDMAAEPEPEAIDSQADPAGFDFEAEAALDVDTEALSAMIDARLAQPEAADSADSPQVWRVVASGAVPAVQPDAVAEAAATPATPLPDAAPAAVPDVALVDGDADVLASLPSLDDWALVDHDASPAAVDGDGVRKAPAPVLSDAFAGLELVPMETVAPLRVDADPIERWFGGNLGKKVVANDPAESDAKEVSHERG